MKQPLTAYQLLKKIHRASEISQEEGMKVFKTLLSSPEALLTPVASASNPPEEDNEGEDIEDEMIEVKLRDNIVEALRLEQHLNSLHYFLLTFKPSSNSLDNKEVVKEIQTKFKSRTGYKFATTILYEELSEKFGFRNWNLAKAKGLQFANCFQK